MTGEIFPVTPNRLDDLAALFGTSKTTTGCYCMWFIHSASECRAGWDGGNRRAFEGLVATQPEPMGLLAYRDGRAVGWCAAGPRDRYRRALRSPLLKARDIAEDQCVWVVPCFYVRRDARGAGVTRALLEAAVAAARGQQALAIEGFPIAGTARRPAAAAYVGVEPLFASAGFRVILRPSPSRVIMRRELNPA